MTVPAVGGGGAAWSPTSPPIRLNKLSSSAGAAAGAAASSGLSA